MVAHSNQVDVYHSNHLDRMGRATVLVCSGTDQEGDSLGEYHVLLPSEDCQLVSQQLHARETTLESIMEKLDNGGWSFHQEVYTLATNRLELMYWERLQAHDQRPSSAPTLELEGGEKTDLLRLAIRGECRDALEAIKDRTQFHDIKSWLTGVLGVGEITIESLEGDDP